jgi:hypothetical protein
MRLVGVVGVFNNNYLAVTKRPEDVVVEGTKKFSGELLITRSVNNQRRRVAHRGHPRGTALLKH